MHTYISQAPKRSVIIAAVLIAITGALFTSIWQAEANPTGFVPTAQTSAATTTPAYLARGTSIATSTLVYDSYGVCGTNQTQTGNFFAADSAALAMMFAASSSATTYNMQVEYSQNCVDWYQNNLGNTGGLTIATTSQLILNTTSINNVQNFSYTFASSTQGGAGATTTNSATSTKLISLPTPTRAVRIIFSTIGGDGAIWAQIIPKKQNK